MIATVSLEENFKCSTGDVARLETGKAGDVIQANGKEA